MIESRRLAPPMLLASVLAAISQGTVLLLLPIDGLESGGLFGGFALPGVVAVGSASMPIVGAHSIARFGHKRILCGGLLLAAIGILVIAGSDALHRRAGGALIYGVGLGLFTLSRVTYLSDAVVPDQRGRIVSAVGGMGRIGLFAGPALGGALATYVARDAALASAGGVLGGACLAALWLPSCPTLPSARRRRHFLAFVGDVLRDHRDTFTRVGLVMLALAFVRSARMLLVPICGTMLGLDMAVVGLAKSASMGADMLLFYPAGLVMDRRGRKWTAVPCLVVLSLGVLWIGWAETASSLVFGAVLAGVGNGLGAGINMTLAGDLSPREGRAEFLGVWALLTEAGAVSSPFATGWLAQSLALGPAALVVATVGVCASVFMAMRIPEPLELTRSEGARE